MEQPGNLLSLSSPTIMFKLLPQKKKMLVEMTYSHSSESKASLPLWHPDCIEVIPQHVQ